MAEPKDFIYAHVKDILNEDPNKEAFYITEKAFWDYNKTINMEEPQEEVIKSLGLDAMLQRFCPCGYHGLGDTDIIAKRLDSLGFQFSQELQDCANQDLNRFKEHDEKLKKIFEDAKANGTNPFEEMNKHINEEWATKQPTLENFDAGLFFSPGHFSILDQKQGNTEYLPEFWNGYHGALNEDDKWAPKRVIIANWVPLDEETKEYEVDLKVYNSDTDEMIARVVIVGKVVESDAAWLTLKLRRIEKIEVAV